MGANELCQAHELRKETRRNDTILYLSIAYHWNYFPLPIRYLPFSRRLNLQQFGPIAVRLLAHFCPDSPFTVCLESRAHDGGRLSRRRVSIIHFAAVVEAAKPALPHSSPWPSPFLVLNLS